MPLFYFRDLMWVSLSLMLMNSEEKEINCGSHFTSRTGTVSTPNYPNKYSPNLNCVWSIHVSGNNPEIKLKFSIFSLPEKVNGKCTDYVSIYHGTDAMPSKLVGTYCGSRPPSTQLHKVNSIEMHFVSNEDDITDKGFMMSFTVSVASASITTSQATAGIVAAIFCGIVFIGVAAMRCIMMGACQQCHLSQNQHNQTRECVGTNETMSNYVMDCPPSYRTVMEHPENFPTPHITPYPTPSSSARVSVVELEENDGEPPPPYVCFATSATLNTASAVQSTTSTNTTTSHQTTENRSQSQGISAHDVAERLLSRHSRNVIAVVERHDNNEDSLLESRINNGRHDQQSEQSTDSLQPSVEGRERSTDGNDTSLSTSNIGQTNTSGTDQNSDSNGTNNHNDIIGTNDQNDRYGTRDQTDRSEVSDGTVDQIGHSERNNHNSDNSTNGTSHQRRSNRRIHQHDVTGKPRHDADSSPQYVEVRL